MHEVLIVIRSNIMVRLKMEFKSGSKRKYNNENEGSGMVQYTLQIEWCNNLKEWYFILCLFSFY